jgi:rfaE bifunctional protein kinase chain/domain
MSHPHLSKTRARRILQTASRVPVLVVGDVMLDHFIWGDVGRISPEAPVPVVDFIRESYMPGGAANVARNLTSLEVKTELFGIIGQDDAAQKLSGLLRRYEIGCRGLLVNAERPTSLKTRIVAHKQQVVRIDREARNGLAPSEVQRLLAGIEKKLASAGAVILGDYGKGVISQPFLDDLKTLSRKQGIWLSLDPKPTHKLDLTGFSLITPNRKEAFELAGLPDDTRNGDPIKDASLLLVARQLLERFRPAILLITLGELGMLLCERDRPPFHIPTLAQEVFDVSGAGDTVISVFTLAIVGGASPLEAAILANHAAGIVVGKVGTATVSPDELLASF